MLDSLIIKMNNENIQDLEELKVINVFMKQFPIVGELLPKRKHQKPDVLIKQNNTIIGIEITELKNYAPKIEGLQRAIAQGLSNELKEIHGNKYFASLYFTNKATPKSDIKLIKEYITAKISNEIVNRSINNKIFSSITCNNPYIRRIIIKYYRIENTDMKHRHASINIPELGWVNENPELLIRDIIEKKNTKIEEYLKCCSECWLLIYNNELLSEGQFEYNINYMNIDRLRFSRVFLLNLKQPKLSKEIARI